MDFDTLTKLRASHPGWRLLTAENAPLIVSFLERVFLKENVRALSRDELVRKLDDHLFHIRERLPQGAYPRSASQYLDDWADDAHGWLRKYYRADSDEPQFDLSVAAEKTIDWLMTLAERQLVGTESRLLTVFQLLRELVERTQLNPQARLAELHKRRALIDSEIAEVERGNVQLMDPVQVKDRFLQMASTARGLLSDFREVENNFRKLDRAVRERIATWEGAKGELLADVFGERDAIADSEQGKSFRAFWDFLMSPSRQDELTALLDAALALPAVKELAPDPRLARIHYDWLVAGDVAQRTVARLSEQLRRYLDDATWLDDKRVVRIVRDIEQKALSIRALPPSGMFMELDESGPCVELPADRPLFTPPFAPRFDARKLIEGGSDIPIDGLYDQVYVDTQRLAANIRRALHSYAQVTLGELVTLHPLEQGLAELVCYMNLAAFDTRATIDAEQRQAVSWIDSAGSAISATMPLVVFTR